MDPEGLKGTSKAACPENGGYVERLITQFQIILNKDKKP
jgi:hypothetical protein